MENERIERKIVYPKGSDRETLKKLHSIASERRKEQFTKQHEEFIKTAKLKAESLSPLVDMLNIDRKRVEETISNTRKAMQERIGNKEPPTFESEVSHNPVRYAPFDMPYTNISCGGITYCSLRNDPNSGEIGADLAIFNGGGGSSVSSIGFWYYAGQSGTLSVIINASVWGSGYVFSALFGYASAYARLRAYIEKYSSDFKVYTSSTNIYDRSGVLEFDITNFDWQSFSVGISIPVDAGTWYAIWADAVQGAYAGGIADSVSNFDMYVNSVVYSLDGGGPIM
ncbi:MAG: hypothetical protein JO297_14445 [Nitrososphaeraceae archaeon]|nr:hypothetical protein [Nitrososphaeraceae archaeon]